MMLYTHIQNMILFLCLEMLPKLNVALLSKQKGVKVDRGKTVNKKWNRYRSSLKL